MDRHIRQAALRAAAKTAVLVSLSGCYEMHLRPVPVALVVDGGGPREDAQMFVDEGPPPAPDLGERACAELLGGLALTVPEPTGSSWSWGAQFTDERARFDPRVGACCVEVEEAVHADPPLASVGSPLAMACCAVIVDTQRLVSSSSLGCTPWGPACPPEISDEDELEVA
jgi:hypothetical protein